MSGIDGIYGGRFSGAGFKGCCMAIINPRKEDAIVEKVTKEYLAAFPHLEGKYMAAVCKSADGVQLYRGE
jgi:galactokinase/galacturonokinase